MFQRLAVLAGVFVAAVCGAAAAVPPPPVLVVADVFADLPESLRPQPGKPIYYAIAGKYETDIGTRIPGEPSASAEAIEAEVTKVLTTQGFIKTKVGGPMPSIALIITWGSARLDLSELPNAPLPTRYAGNPPDPNSLDPFAALDPMAMPPTVSVGFNVRAIRQLIGADKASAGALDSGTLNEINAAADSPRGYIFIAAFDMEAMVKKKEKKMVWRTRISIDSTRHSLPDSLGLMLTSAAPFLGREVATPAFIGEADRRKAEVQLGTPYVVPDKPAADAGKKAK